MIESVGEAVRTEPRVRLFLESPRVSGPERARRSRPGDAESRFPSLFVEFLQSVIRHRRQMLFPEIRDRRTGSTAGCGGGARARRRDASRAALTDTGCGSAWRRSSHARWGEGSRWTRRFGQGEYPALVGGAIVRIGDMVIDGSVRNRLARLRRQLEGTHGGR